VTSIHSEGMKHEVGGWYVRVTGISELMTSYEDCIFLCLSDHFFIMLVIGVDALRGEGEGWSAGLGGGWGSSFGSLGVTFLYRTWCRIRIRSRYISPRRHVCAHCSSYDLWIKKEGFK
jgi:hypothetical protein